MVLDIETIAVIIRITSGASIALYIVLLSLLCFKLKLQFMSKAFNIQFLLSNLIYSFSTVLPDVSTNTFLCKGQSMLTVFSELTTIGIGTSIVIIGQLSLAPNNKLNEMKGKIFTVSFIQSWLIPIIFGFVAFAFTEVKADQAKTDSKLCWITDDYCTMVFIALRMVYFIVFFYYLYKMLKELKKLKINLNLGDLYNEYLSSIKKCALGMTMLLIIFLSYSTANLIRIFSIDKALINHWVFLTIVIGDAFVHPIVVFLFIINKEKLNQIKTLCHKNKEYISIETVTNSDDSLID